MHYTILHKQPYQTSMDGMLDFNQFTTVHYLHLYIGSQLQNRVGRLLAPQYHRSTRLPMPTAILQYHIFLSRIRMLAGSGRRSHKNSVPRGGADRRRDKKPTSQMRLVGRRPTDDSPGIRVTSRQSSSHHPASRKK